LATRKSVTISVSIRNSAAANTRLSLQWIISASISTISSAIKVCISIEGSTAALSRSSLGGIVGTQVNTVGYSVSITVSIGGSTAALSRVQFVGIRRTVVAQTDVTERGHTAAKARTCEPGALSTGLDDIRILRNHSSIHSHHSDGKRNCVRITSSTTKLDTIFF
jgi:hypothetical protein